MATGAPAWYLSFTDEGGWLGAVILRAPDDPPTAPLTRAWEIGANPGGEVMAIRLTPEKAAAVPVEFWDVLLGKDDLRGLGEIVEPGGGELVSGTADELRERLDEEEG